MILLDESGSMGSLADAVRDATAEFINSLEKDETGKYTASIATFDSSYPNDGVWVRYAERNVPLHVLKDNSASVLKAYQPSGGTPLLDSVRTIIKDAEEDAPDTTPLVFIYTDGHENASTSTAKEKLSRMVSKREKAGWNFVFFGADMDAWSGGASLGLTQKGSMFNVFNTQTGLTGTATAMASITRSYRAGTRGGSLYSANASMGDTIPEQPFSGTNTTWVPEKPKKK